MAKDFRSKQIRTSKLIGSGGVASRPYLGLAVYDHRHAVNNAGTQKYDGTIEPGMLDKVGKDVWMFVSGSRSYPKYTWPGSTPHMGQGEWLNRNLTGVQSGYSGYHGGKTVLFGGDVVVSGTLFAERQVIEVDEAVRGDLLIPNDAHISGTMTFWQGAVFNIGSGSTGYVTDGSGVTNPGSDFVVHGSTTANMFFIDSSTNRIGVGDNTPESLFNIKSTAVDALTDVGAPANYHLRLEGSETTNKGTGLAFGGDNEVGASIIYKVKGAKSKGELQFYTKDSTSNDADPVQRMVITSNGRVGIGEDGDSYDFDPAGLLEIMGDGDNGPQLQLSNNSADYAKFEVGTNGDLTITTVDAAAGAANFVVVADGAVDIDANVGALSLDGSTGINIGTETDVAIDIDSSTLDIDASGAITIDGTSTLSIDSADDSNVTVTGSGKDLILAAAGGGAQKLQLDSAGTGTDSIDITASAGGIDVDSAGKLALDGAGGIDIGVSADVAIDIDSSTLDIDASGAITMDSTSTIVISGDGGATFSDDVEGLAYDGSGNVDFDAVALDIDASGAITMDSTSTIVISGDGGATFSDDTEALVYDGSGNVDFDAVALDIDASGAITIDGGSTMSLDAVDDSNITVTGSGKELTLEVAGGGAQRLELKSAGTGARAIDIDATAGGLDVDINGILALDSETQIDIGKAQDVPIDIDSSTLDIDASGAVTIDGSSTISIDGAGALNIDTSSGALSVGTANSGIAVNIGHATSEVTVGDNLTVQGNLTVNGTTTTVNSTTMTVDDPVLTLGGDVAPGADDNKDRGIEFRWHNGSGAKTGFMGYDDDQSVFTLIPDATNSSEVFSGSPGTLRVRQVDLYDDGAENISGDGTDISITVGAGGDINIPANIGLTFGDDGEKIEGDGTDLTISGNNINLTAVADVVIPANVGILFGSGEKIEGDNTDLTITSGGAINLTAVTDINIPSGVGLTFAATEKIESDGTDLSISVGAGGDVNLPADIGLTFGDDGEKIEGDGTDLTLSSSNLLNLTAATDVVIPVNVGLILDGSGAEKIESDGTDINISVGAGGDINIPADIGLTFGNPHERIEGDGTDLTVHASNNFTVDAAGDISLDAAGGDIDFKQAGTTRGTIRTDSANALRFMDSGGVEVFQVDGSNSALKMTGTRPILLGSTTSYIKHDGTDLELADAADINLKPGADLLVDAGGDIILDAGGANVTIKDDGVTTLDIVSNGATDVTFDAPGDIILDAAGGDIKLNRGGSARLRFDISTGVSYIQNGTDGSDIAFRLDAGSTEIARFDDSASSLLMASGKKIEFGSANVAISNTNNNLVIASHLTNVNSEETYYSGDVFVSGTLTPNALSLSNIDLASSGYVRFGDSNNYIQRVSNDLTFRDSATGAVKTLGDLASIGAISTAFEILATQSPDTLKIRSTGSFALSSANQYAEQVASDLFFYVSGSVDRGSTTDVKAAAFGGDVVITGSLKAGAKIDTWSYSGANHFYSLSASMEEVGFQAPLVGKNIIGSDVLSILPGYDINKSANNSLVSILGEVSDGNIIFGFNDGGTATEVMRLQGNNASLRMAASKNLEFAGTSRYINSTSTNTINYVNSNANAAHTFTGHIIPATNYTYDLGAATLRFRNVYTGDLNLKNERGDWTILEEEDFLCVINNKTGKKFKMMLEPIEENE